MTEPVKIYVNGEFYMACFSEFGAMNNIHTLRCKYGKDNVTTVIGTLTVEEKQKMLEFVG